MSAIDPTPSERSDALSAILTRLDREEQAVSALQRSVADLEGKQQHVARLLARAVNPFVAGGSALPPVGKPADFWDKEAAAKTQYYLGDETVERLKRDNLPLPDFSNNEGYATIATPVSLLRYWLFGLADYLKVMKTARSHGLEVHRVLDFGASTGRAFRHFYCQDEPKEIWACDFKTASVDWCLRYMPRDIRVFLNTFVPGLPIQCGYFDVIVAFSVFTHIDELESAWLLEFKRLLRPGGIAYITIHDETTWKGITEDQLLARLIRETPNGSQLVVGSAMPEERIAFRPNDESHYSAQVFHRSDYIRKNWGRFFHIAEIISNDHEAQAVVICVNQ